MGDFAVAFSWTYAWTQIPVGWLAERYGAHRILAAGLALWASATILIGFAHTFATLLVLRLLLGLGESAGFPELPRYWRPSYPPRGLGTANGIIALGYLSGPVVGTLAGGLLMAHFGWRSAFWVFGGLSLAVAAALDEGGRQGSKRRAREQGRIADVVDDIEAAVAVGARRWGCFPATMCSSSCWRGCRRICRPSAAFPSRTWRGWRPAPTWSMP